MEKSKTGGDNRLKILKERNNYKIRKIVNSNRFVPYHNTTISRQSMSHSPQPNEINFMTTRNPQSPSNSCQFNQTSNSINLLPNGHVTVDSTGNPEDELETILVEPITIESSMGLPNDTSNPRQINFLTAFIANSSNYLIGNAESMTNSLFCTQVSR